MSSYPPKPVIGGDAGVWGYKINAIFDALFAAEDSDMATLASLIKEVGDARGAFPSLAARLASLTPAGSSNTGGSAGGTTAPTVVANAYVGAANTYAINHY